VRTFALGRAVLTVLGLVLVVASLPWLRGEDPARTVLRVRFHARGDDPEAVAALRADLDLAPDPFTGAVRWLGDALRGDLGASWVSGQPVSEHVVPALAASATLALTSLAVALVVSALVLLPVVRRAASTGRPTRARVGVVATTVAALPEAIVGTVLVLVVAVHLRLLPATGWDGWSSLVLPALALGLPSAGLIVRVLSGVVDQTLAEQWTTTWRANGVAPRALGRSVVRRVVALGAPQLVVVWTGMLGTAVAVEKVFTVPGAGSLAVEAALTQDLPVLQAALLGLVGLGLLAAAVALLTHRVLLRATRGRDDLSAPVAATPGSPWAVGVALGLLLLVVVGGLPRDGATSDLGRRLAPPSSSTPMGADAVGHDLWGRAADATLTTVGIAVVVTLACTVLGLVVGLCSRQARVGAVDVLVTVPSTVVGLVVVAVSGPGLTGAAVAVGAVAWLPLAVHARSLVVQARGAGHVGAARRLGLGAPRVLLVHLLPAVLGPLLLHALARLPLVGVAIAGLSFIGLGADPDAAELGAMLAEGLRYLETAPWAVLVPGGVLLLLGVAAGSAGAGGLSRRRARAPRGCGGRLGAAR